MITELGISNFKAFSDMQRVPIKPLTLIFGANSSGKSSIIQALLLAHHGMETGEYDVHQTKLAGDVVDLGGFRSYVHRHDASRTIDIHLETDVDPQPLIDHLDGAADEKEPFLKLSRFGLRLTLACGDRLLELLDGTEPIRSILARANWAGVGITQIAIFIDRQHALTFCGVFTTRPVLFRARPLPDLGRFLEQLLTTEIGRARARHAREAETPSSFPKC